MNILGFANTWLCSVIAATHDTNTWWTRLDPWSNLLTLGLHLPLGGWDPFLLPSPTTSSMHWPLKLSPEAICFLPQMTLIPETRAHEAFFLMTPLKRPFSAFMDRHWCYCKSLPLTYSRCSSPPVAGGRFWGGRGPRRRKGTIH